MRVNQSLLQIFFKKKYLVVKELSILMVQNSDIQNSISIKSFKIKMKKLLIDCHNELIFVYLFLFSLCSLCFHSRLYPYCLINFNLTLLDHCLNIYTLSILCILWIKSLLYLYVINIYIDVNLDGRGGGFAAARPSIVKETENGGALAWNRGLHLPFKVIVLNYNNTLKKERM